MAYRIEISSIARRQIKKLARSVQDRIRVRIRKLAEEPRPRGCTKLVNEDEYRIRVGDYRVIYEIYDDELVVKILEAGHRRDIYR